MAGNSCPPHGSSLAEDWDPSRILTLKQRTGGVVLEVLNQPAMGCDPFGIRNREWGRSFCAWRDICLRVSR